MAITHIIFDMDGVLVDAREWHYLAFRNAINKFDFDVTPEEHESEYDGLSTRQKLDKLTKTKGLPTSLHPQIQEIKQSQTMEVMLENCQPSEIKLDMFQQLSAKYTLAVASNSIRNTIQTVLDSFTITPFFKLVLSNEDVEHPKPDPQIYHSAMKQLNTQANTTLIIEDSPIGVAAATASGAHILVVKDSSEVSLERITERINQINSLT